MSEPLQPSLPRAWMGPLLPALLVVTALAGGIAASGALSTVTIAVAAVLGLAMVAALMGSPRMAMYLVLVQISVFPVLPLVEGRGMNPIDLLLPPAVLGAWFWTRPVPKGRGASVADRAVHTIQRGAMAYYGVALFSLAVLALSGRPFDALDSLLVLSRSFQGALFFYLMTRLIKTEGQLKMARNAVLVGLGAALVLNSLSMLFAHVPRAGSVWVQGTPMARTGASWSVGIGGWIVTNPNELSMGCLMVTALLLVLPMRRLPKMLILFATFVLLLLTQSRGGILAWLIMIALYSLRGGSRAVWIFPLATIALFSLLPEEFQARMLRTLTLQKGSFEAYSSLIRVFCWQASTQVFLAHPIFGVGYLGFRFVSRAFNPLGAVLTTSESFFLETASGMGVLGLAALAFFGYSVLSAMSSLGRGAPRGSTLDRFARITPAYLLGLAVANLTGDLLIGLLAVSQLAVFLGFAVQSARLRDAAADLPEAH